MQETIDLISEKLSFEDKDKVSSFLLRCISVSNDTSKSTYAIYDNILFKIDAFFTELHKLTNLVKKDKKLPLTVETLMIVLEELGIEISKEEAFILFHLKDLGKFRLKDSKFKEQLKGPWEQYKEYAQNDRDFEDSLKSLTGQGFITYRKGTIETKRSLIIRYKNQDR